MARLFGSVRALGALALVGLVATVVVGPTVSRPWIALAAAMAGLVFVCVYSRRAWRSTVAGRAAMVFTVAVTVLLANASAILWWPGGGYPLWEHATTFLYLGVGLAIVYKLGALLGVRGRDK